MPFEKTKDSEIRDTLLLSSFISKLKEEDSLVMQEFGLGYSGVRIDVAVFNGRLHGFEIKSDQDTLDRLPNQISCYEKIFQYLYLVVGTKYLDRAVEIIPQYWGVIVAEKHLGVVSLNKYRVAKQNKKQDPLSVASMLWREEALCLLKKHGLAQGMKKKPRHNLWTRLSETLAFKELEAEVRSAIKARQDWRVDLQRERCDEMSQRASMSSRFLSQLPF